MIPLWKVKRELGRFGQQLRSIPERITDPIAQRRLDHALAAGLPQSDGALPVSPKIALVLIFQPNGIAPSTQATCDWLAAAGYAPFIMSNTPLSQSDKTALSPHVWRMVERPNFGYDFGGYRDGLTCLERWGIAPETLLILNDSIWLPTLPDTDLLQRMEASDADIAGSILRTRGDEQFLESYLFRINAKALQSNGFRAYWADLRLTSNKYFVIRRGERGFSAAMRAAGLTLAPMFDFDGLAQDLRDQSDDMLRKTLRYASYMDATLAAENARLLPASGPDWRDQVLDHVTRALVKHQGYSCFPYAAIILGHYPILKKSNDRVAQGWRAAYCAAVNKGDLPQPPTVIWHELQARVARDSSG